MSSSGEITEPDLDPNIVFHCSIGDAFRGALEEPTFIPMVRGQGSLPTTKYTAGWACLEALGRRTQPGQPAIVTEDWESSFSRLLGDLSSQFSAKIEDEFRISVLEKNVHALTNAIRTLEARKAILVPIESFAPEPLEVIKPFFVVVAPDDDEFTATWFDANIAATGDNEVEAVAILKDFINAQFEQFSRLEIQDKLGPGPRRELALMKEFLRAKS